MIAWDLDAAGMLAVHREFWEASQRVRPNIDTADFRIPTTGHFWDFDCRFESQSGSVRTRGDVVSYSFLIEVAGTLEAPLLMVRCQAPEATPSHVPSSVILTRSVRAPFEMPSIHLKARFPC